MSILCLTSCFVAALFAFAGASHAQTYPDRPIRLIIPFGPGGGGDLMGRLLADPLAKRLGQPVVIENRAGADQIVGTQALVVAPRDGYTILLSNNTLLTAVAFQRKLPFEPMTDLLPIGRIANVPILLLVNPALGVKSLKELIAAAKGRPGQIKAGHIGTASSHYMSFKLIEQAAGVGFFLVPYKGTGPALQGLLRGETDANFAGIGAGMELDKAGKVMALGITTKKRSAAFPNVTTISEAGLPGFDFAAIFYIYGASGIPAQAISRLSRDLRASLDDPLLRGKLVGAGFEVEPSTPEEAQAEHREQLNVITQLIKSAGLKADD